MGKERTKIATSATVTSFDTSSNGPGCRYMDNIRTRNANGQKKGGRRNIIASDTSRRMRTGPDTCFTLFVGKCFEKSMERKRIRIYLWIKHYNMIYHRSHHGAEFNLGVSLQKG